MGGARREGRRLAGPPLGRARREEIPRPSRAGDLGVQPRPRGVLRPRLSDHSRPVRMVEAHQAAYRAAHPGGRLRSQGISPRDRRPRRLRLPVRRRGARLLAGLLARVRTRPRLRAGRGFVLATRRRASAHLRRRAQAFPGLPDPGSEHLRQSALLLPRLAAQELHRRHERDWLPVPVHILLHATERVGRSHS